MLSMNWACVEAIAQGGYERRPVSSDGMYIEWERNDDNSLLWLPGPQVTLKYTLGASNLSLTLPERLRHLLIFPSIIQRILLLHFG